MFLDKPASSAGRQEKQEGRRKQARQAERAMLQEVYFHRLQLQLPSTRTQIANKIIFELIHALGLTPFLSIEPPTTKPTPQNDDDDFDG